MKTPESLVTIATNDCNFQGLFYKAVVSPLLFRAVFKSYKQLTHLFFMKSCSFIISTCSATPSCVQGRRMAGFNNSYILYGKETNVGVSSEKCLTCRLVVCCRRRRRKGRKTKTAIKRMKSQVNKKRIETVGCILSNRDSCPV